MCRETSARVHLPSWQRRFSVSRPAKSSTNSLCTRSSTEAKPASRQALRRKSSRRERGRRPVARVRLEAAGSQRLGGGLRPRGAPCGVVRAVPANSARRRTRSGKRTPHSQACCAPIEKPSASSTRSMPRSSRRRRCASTSSPIVRSGNGASLLLGEDDSPLPSWPGQMTNHRCGSSGRPGPIQRSSEAGVPEYMVGEEDGVVPRCRKRPVRPIGEPRGRERPAELELEVLEVEGARLGGRHCAL